MIYLDTHESIELELLLSQCAPVERALLNPERGDVWWIDAQGRQVSFELKQNGELLGSLESVEEQLAREMQNVDYLGLGIRGIITPTVSGYCQTWKVADGNPNIIRKAQEYRHSYKGLRAWLARLQELGIVVIETPDVHSMAIALIAQYENSLKAEQDHHTFKRLITTKAWIAELDTDKARFTKQLMAIVPGCGEDIGLALADVFPDLATLLNIVESGAEDKVAGVPLRLKEGVRGRTVGPAFVKSLKREVGL